MTRHAQRSAGPFLLTLLGRQKSKAQSGGATPGFRFVYEVYTVKAKPAVRVLPDAILLSCNKSMQKCLLLTEGYKRSPRVCGVQGFLRRRPARYRGPNGRAFLTRWLIVASCPPNQCSTLLSCKQIQLYSFVNRNRKSMDASLRQDLLL